MNKKLLFFQIHLLLVFTACNRPNILEVKNPKKGQLKSKIELHVGEIKKFPLDSLTAPRGEYTQIFVDDKGNRNFTFLNKNNNSVYFYDYDNLKFLKKITFNEQGFNEKVTPIAYYIKSIDSIYVYNISNFNLMLANSDGVYYKRISLIGNKTLKNVPSWIFSYPQYFPRTSVPFLATSNELLLTGQYMEPIPDSIINKFKFIAHVDYGLNKVNYSNTYPVKIFGSNYNWDESFNECYVDLAGGNNKLVISFPASHDLYISNLNTNSYTQIYGGSNIANTIASASIKETSREKRVAHVIKYDAYGAIKYDRYRNVYYRFLRKGIPNATIKTEMDDKPIIVIVMDGDFKYLGETQIGTSRNWYLQDTFVTKEGLNIEYIENILDENYLTLKVLKIRKIL
jgi:hypothetical protein